MIFRNLDNDFQKSKQFRYFTFLEIVKKHFTHLINYKLYKNSQVIPGIVSRFS